MTAPKLEIQDPAPESESAAPASLLLVDDHNVTAEIERTYFANAGYRVFKAASPQEIEQIVRSESIDLLIIDLAFAKGQGLKCLARAKKSSANPELKVIA